MGFVQALGSSVPHQSAGQASPRETSAWRSATGAPERRGRQRSRWRRWTSKIRWWLRYMTTRWCWNSQGPNIKSSKVHNHSDELMVSCLPMVSILLDFPVKQTKKAIICYSTRNLPFCSGSAGMALELAENGYAEDSDSDLMCLLCDSAAARRALSPPHLSSQSSLPHSPLPSRQGNN